MTDKKTDIANKSRIQIHRQSNGWRVEVVHHGGGVTGVMAPFPSLDDVVTYLKERYEVD